MPQAIYNLILLLTHCKGLGVSAVAMVITSKTDKIAIFA